MAKLCDVAGLDDSLFHAGAVFKPDGKLEFASRSGKTKGEIQFKQVGNEWIAEFRYRFRCGACHGHTIPLSVFSLARDGREDALADAAHRLLEDAAARCGDPAKLAAVQRRELAELLTWATTVKIEQNTKLPTYNCPSII